nr:RNA-directed DNA polymerase, eukaryota [Tanacetum cinerariifolium]
MWDPNSFRRSSTTRSDYFVILRGVWLKLRIDILIVVVYAPQEAKEKRMLWDYLSHVSNQWDGKIVMMGDFNEVRYKSNRFGSNFNAHDAEIFNSFIYNAGLKEVPLGGIEGDENVKFFHGMLNKKRSQYNIRGVMVNGTWVDDRIQVKLEFFDHFRGRFEKPSENRACIDISFPNSLSNDQKEDLERKITKKEVKRAVWDCGVDKSPGPDGFSFSIYRHFWTTNEHDAFEAVDYFFMHGDMLNGCNSNFIALIPKILDANMVKDFRPISLIGSLYKITAKILANRLVGVLDDLVNEVQSAFVTDRQILDGPFILNEVLQWCRRKKKNTLIFKVYFEKAYDSVRWDFLDDVLNKFGFGEKWRTWIKSFLRSYMGSILVNGSPTKEFQFFRGLKQGDPLSHFLFILIMESLHISFQRVVDASLFTGIKINSMVNLSNLFYADDAIFLGQWSELNIDSLVQVLEFFFGLLVSILTCTPLTYLGTKVGDIMSRKHAWKEVVDKDPKSKKASWVKWNNVLTPKDKGVSRLYSLNRGLMLKWVWRFYSQKCSLWTKVIKAIHGEDKSLDKDGIGVVRTCWTSIVQEVRVMQGRGVNVADYIRLKLGNRNNTRFWMTNESDGVFSVASIRKEIDGKRFQDVSLSTRWVKYVPIKVNIIVWKVKSNAFPTRFNISRRGMDIDSIICPICNAGVEMTNHLFFQCNVVRQIMRKISSWWNVDYLDVNSYEEWRAWLVSIRIQSRLKGVLEGVYYGLWWSM